MPYDLIVTDDGRGLLYKGSGLLAGQEIIESKLELLASEERTRRVAFGRIDLTEVASAEITSEEVRQMVALDKRIAALTPRAVVAVIASGLARMWELLAESTGWRIAVVRTAVEADAWLNAELVAGA